MKQGYVYILANKRNGTLYTGVTSDLIKRIWQHKNHVVDGFTDKYNVDKLVYYEVFDSMEIAISREKELKGKLRQKKINLINSFNPRWCDLYDEIRL